GGELAKFVDRGQRVPNRQHSELFAVSSEEVVWADYERACVYLDQLFEDRIEITIAARMHNMQMQPERVSCRLRDTGNGRGDSRHRRVDQKTNGGNRGQQFVQQLQPLRCYLYVQTCHAGHVATGSVKAGDKSNVNWVGRYPEDDWNARRRRLRR